MPELQLLETSFHFPFTIGEDHIILLVVLSERQYLVQQIIFFRCSLNNKLLNILQITKHAVITILVLRLPC